jgi:FMN phosphatase YigB (HAD superfamily)
VDDFFYHSDFPELRGLSPSEDLGVLLDLASRGYRLGVVSEYPVRRKLLSLGLGKVPWSAMVDCEQVGTLKPAPEVFLEGARQLGLSACEILLVGDRKDADMAGAERAGMSSAWLKHRDPGHGGGPTPRYILGDLQDLREILPPLPRRDERATAPGPGRFAS